MVVERDDIIQFAKITHPNTTITWQQNFGHQREDFTMIAFTVKGRSDGGVLFVQRNHLTDLLGKCTEVDASDGGALSKEKQAGGYEVTVDNTFQYGQTNDRTNRFLVYQERSNRMHQNIFTNTTAIASLEHEWGNTVQPFIHGFRDAVTDDYLRAFH
jgi:hypothetical protein